MTELTGGCGCGGVRDRMSGPFRPAEACHCDTCRRTSGHYWAATSCRTDALTLESKATLEWWDSSPGHRRGFCNRCGSSLFWTGGEVGHISVGAGSLDRPTGLALAGHIFVAEKGDYYAIPAGAPQAEHWPEPGADWAGEDE